MRLFYLLAGTDGCFVKFLVLDVMVEAVVGLAADFTTGFLGAFVDDVFRIVVVLLPPNASDMLPDFRVNIF